MTQTIHHAKGFEIASDRLDRNRMFYQRFEFKKKIKRLFNERLVRPYSLYRGKDKYPRQKDMTWGEAFLLNQSYIKSFINAVDKDADTQSKLWSWKNDYQDIREVEALYQNVYTTFYDKHKFRRAKILRYAEDKGFVLT